MDDSPPDGAGAELATPAPEIEQASPIPIQPLHWLQRLGAFAAIGSFLTAFVVIAPLAILSRVSPPDPEAARADVRLGLKGFYLEADAIFHEGLDIRPGTTTDDFKRYIEKVGAFSTRLERWLDANMSPAAKSRLLRINPSHVNLTFRNSISAEHRAVLLLLMQYLDALDAMLISPAWDKPR
jgi:hypothetical protein